MGEGGSGNKGSNVLGTHGPTFKNNGEYLLAGATNYYVALVNMLLRIPSGGSGIPPASEGGNASTPSSRNSTGANVRET